MRARGPFLARFVVAAMAMMLLCVLTYVFLGWAIWTNQPWLKTITNPRRFSQWHYAYARVAGALLPFDSDGDGVCDGLELFLHSDPRNAANHPIIIIVWEHGGFDAQAMSAEKPFLSLQSRWLVTAGERTRIRGQMFIAGDAYSLPAGFRIQLAPPSYASLALPESPPVAGPLTVPVSRDGSMVFDLYVSRGATTDPSREEPLTIANAATGERLLQLDIRRIWPAATITPKWNDFPFANPAPSSTHPIPGSERLIRLEWPPLASGDEAAIIEAARDADGAEWFPLRIDPPSTTSCVIAQHFSLNRVNSYCGPLKFRIVPVRFSPP